MFSCICGKKGKVIIQKSINLKDEQQPSNNKYKFLKKNECITTSNGNNNHQVNIEIINSSNENNKINNGKLLNQQHHNVSYEDENELIKKRQQSSSTDSMNDEDYVTDKKRRSAIIPLSVHIDENTVIPKYFKDTKDDKLIKVALEKNEFLHKILKNNLLQEVIDAMYSRTVTENEIIIKQGEKGSHLYVSANGKYEISIKGQGIIAYFDDVRVFGELAILYSAKRKATIKSIKPGKVWVLDGSVYQQILVRFNIKEQDEMLHFLENVPILNKVGSEVLQNVTKLLKVEFFPHGSVIIKQGDKGDKFYIIRAGTVTITKSNEGVVGNYKKGKFFGELALLKEDCRQATVIADSPGVECFTLTRQYFIQHFGKLDEIPRTIPQPIKKRTDNNNLSEFNDIELNDLECEATLGVGGFGRVELVRHKKKKNLIFALKSLKKIDMVEQHQQEHVLNEKNIQMNCRSTFIVRLYRTYKDSKFVYFLMECCLGGDLWTLLQKQKNRRFDEKDAQFIAGCVLEAFNYLHQDGIIYRDLKPENLLIDRNGYIKLTDFGFAKRLGTRGKTYTFAGTPEYVAPEIVLNRGHDKAVDYWAFGIFIFELLVGRTPFRTNDSSHMRTYNKILTGIDNIEFPQHISSRARNIIEKLLKTLPADRLGCQKNGVKDIKNHKWFIDFDWDKLIECKLPVPFKPKLKNDIDTQYFDKFKEDTDIPPDEISGWDNDF